MEFAWLEDFLAILDCGGFSRAAESRHVTQSALSRRIRALEQWVGTPLLQRTTHSIALTAAGDAFRTTAEEILRRLAAGRNEAIERAQGESELLQFTSTNALSLVFFPTWLRRIEASFRYPISIQFLANHMDACEKIMTQGQAQFLLCHHHPAMTTLLSPAQFRSLHIGDDVLMPVSVPMAEGSSQPMFALPGSPDAPVPCLAYRKESGMGRIVEASHKIHHQQLWLKSASISHLAKFLVTMTLEKRGMAWLPKSLIDDMLQDGSLVRAGDSTWDIPMEIHIFRSRARQTPIAERFWSYIESTIVVEA